MSDKNIYVLKNINEFKEFVDFLYKNPKYLLHRSSSLNDGDLVFFHKKDIIPLIIDNEEYLNLLKILKDEKYICPSCKTITNVFKKDYRDCGGCVSSYNSCYNCSIFDDESYFTLISQETQEERNRIFYPTYDNPERDI